MNRFFHSFGHSKGNGRWQKNNVKGFKADGVEWRDAKILLHHEKSTMTRSRQILLMQMRRISQELDWGVQMHTRLHLFR